MPLKSQLSRNENGRDVLSGYDYDLPRERIAQTPASRRDESRLMHLLRSEKRIRHGQFRDLPSLLKDGDLLVVNDTRVIPARLVGRKESGGVAEVFLSRKMEDRRWEALLRLSGKARPGLRIRLDDAALTLVEPLDKGLWIVRFEGEEDVEALTRRLGGIPLPPYIDREDVSDRREEDRERYQTVYARHEGAVAAPTAGLHFTEELFNKLSEQGVRRTAVTLHVGLGTFQPLREENLDRVRLHSEDYAIGEDALSAIRETKANGGRVVAVGTTSVRVLEHLARIDGFRPHAGSTELFLRPGEPFRAVDAMITNFHLPKSSLLILVSAFAGWSFVKRAYETAVKEEYRFYSYGDAMLIE